MTVIPVLFKQKRSGEDGREFWCYKFRSMRVNALSDTLQATEHDPRKTRIGDLIRKTNVDELPQFINVLKGDMSLVMLLHRGSIKLHSKEKEGSTFTVRIPLTYVV